MLHPKFRRSLGPLSPHAPVEPDGFADNLHVLIDAIGTPAAVGSDINASDADVVAPHVDAERVVSQAKCFCDSMRRTVSQKPDFTMSAVWKHFSMSSYFSVQCSEWIKLANLSLLMVSDSVEDERVFSAMNSIHVLGDHRNSYLATIVCLLTWRTACE
jgi:hypothetical protein